MNSVTTTLKGGNPQDQGCSLWICMYLIYCFASHEWTLQPPRQVPGLGLLPGWTTRGVLKHSHYGWYLNGNMQWLFMPLLWVGLKPISFSSSLLLTLLPTNCCYELITILSRLKSYAIPVLWGDDEPDATRYHGSCTNRIVSPKGDGKIWGSVQGRWSTSLSNDGTTPALS